MSVETIHCAGPIGGVLWQCGDYVREDRLERDGWRWFVGEAHWRCKRCAQGEGDRRKDAAFYKPAPTVAASSQYHPVSGSIDQYIPWMAPK